MFGIRCVLGTLAVVCLVVLPAPAAQKNELPAAVKEAFAKADQFELLSLDPSRPGGAKVNTFHGWKILGQTTVKNADTRKEVVNAINEGIAKSDGTAAKCFNPRHGIRIVSGKNSFDLVICFECLQIEVYTDNDATESDTTLTTTRTPERVLDKVLKGAKARPAPKPGE